MLAARGGRAAQAAGDSRIDPRRGRVLGDTVPDHARCALADPRADRARGRSDGAHVDEDHCCLPGAAARRRPPATARPGAALLTVDVAAPRGLPGRADRHPPDLRDGARRAQDGRHRPEPPAAHRQQSRSGVSGKKRRSSAPATISRPATPSITPTSATCAGSPRCARCGARGGSRS
jgi:hypothetical protein